MPDSNTPPEMISKSNISVECWNPYRQLTHFSPSLMTAIYVLLIAIMLLTVLTNFIVLYALVTTKQLHNASIRLVFYLSIADVCIGLIGMPLEIKVCFNSQIKRNCRLELYTRFSLIFLGYTSAYIIGLIGYDRYFRIKYLTRYNEKVKTGNKQSAGLILIVVIALLEALLDLHYSNEHEVKAFVIITNIIAAIICALPYLLSISKIKQYKKGVLFKRAVKTVNGVKTRTATRISISLIICYLPYIIINGCHVFVPGDNRIQKQEWFYGIRFLFYNIMHASAFVNAVVFLKYNRKSRSKIMDFLCSQYRADKDDTHIHLRIKNIRVAVIGSS